MPSISYLLRFGQHDGGVLGHIASYYGCIEEQGTGTLHIHMLAWLQGFMSRSELVFSADEAVNVSEISCKRPVDPVNEDFDLKFAADVNKLV